MFYHDVLKLEKGTMVKDDMGGEYVVVEFCGEKYLRQTFGNSAKLRSCTTKALTFELLK